MNSTRTRNALSRAKLYLTSTGLVALAPLALTACSEGDEGTTFAERGQALSQMRIEGEAFDRFNDSDTTHSGDCGSGPVDMETTSDPNGGACNIGWTEAGEWLEYDINLPESGTYDFVFRLASASSGRTLHVEVDGVDVSGPIVSPSAGWQSFENRTSEGIELNSGSHTVRIVFDTGSLNLNYFDIILSQPNAAGDTIVSADFSSGMNGFYYYDLNSYDYVDGGQQSGELQMVLGGQDTATVLDIQGAFERSFWVSQNENVTLSFDYTLAQSCYYETDESSEVRVELDQQPFPAGQAYLARITGNGGSCPGVSTSGRFSETVALGPGRHFLKIVGVNNKKTYPDEVTTLSIDNVLISSSDGQCTPPHSSAYENLCNACGGSVDCSGNCTQNIVDNVGASCGVCGGVVDCDGSCTEPVEAPCFSSPTAEEREAACAKDPRVVAGLVSQDVCTGADIFFRETFEGNGRTCGSCHPVANNYTIDPTFVQDLFAVNPGDPLFIAKEGTALEFLETEALMSDALILENVDGFQDPVNRFVSRSVSHLFSLKTTLAADPADGSDPDLKVKERTGWGGDGAPATDSLSGTTGPLDGSLRAFLDGAIKQHLTKSLLRQPGSDFRTPTELERDAVEAFQLALGRQNELDLNNVQFSLALAEEGKGQFQDPAQGRCGVCHQNAGANFVDSGKNRGFNNGIPGSQAFGTTGFIQNENGDLIGVTDGGFGGADLLYPNLNITGNTVPTGFGDGNFSVPPLVEAADTAPFFHANPNINRNFTTMGNVTFFYGSENFRTSLGNQFLEDPQGGNFGPSQISGQNTAGIPAMLVVLNAVFNIDLARQRLQAAELLAGDLRNIRVDVQLELIRLAGEELIDAVGVLADERIHTNEQSELQATRAQLSSIDATDAWNSRVSDIRAALLQLEEIRSAFGSNFNYQLGSGTLMY